MVDCNYSIDVNEYFERIYGTLLGRIEMIAIELARLNHLYVLIDPDRIEACYVLL